MTLTQSECEHVLIEDVGGIRRIVLNRPAQKNALSIAMYQALTQALCEAAESWDIRVVSITGSDDSFSAGNDLADFIASKAGAELNAGHPVVQFMQAVRALPQPLVAAVNGLAVGIGTTLLLHCDLVYAADDAYFQLPFVRLGLCPEFGASRLLAKRVGEARARELLLLGNRLEAASALELGLINAIYPKERLPAEVDNVCQQLSALPPQALRRSKALLGEVSCYSDERILERELEVFAECLTGSEAQQIFQQMMNKDKA